MTPQCKSPKPTEPMFAGWAIRSANRWLAKHEFAERVDSSSVPALEPDGSYLWRTRPATCCAAAWFGSRPMRASICEVRTPLYNPSDLIAAALRKPIPERQIAHECIPCPNPHSVARQIISYMLHPPKNAHWDSGRLGQGYGINANHGGDYDVFLDVSSDKAPLFYGNLQAVAALLGRLGIIVTRPYANSLRLRLSDIQRERLRLKV